MDKQRLREAAFKILKKSIRLKKGEKVTLVTDRKNDPIFNALRKEVLEMGGKLTVASITSNREHSSPIPKIKDVLIQSDVIIAPTTKSISHSPETRLARTRYGARVASMPGITPSLFLKAAKADVRKIKKLNFYLYGLLRKARRLNVSTPSGTSMEINVRKGQHFHLDDYGDISKGGVINNIPFGEVCIFISDASGKVVIDASRVAKRGSTVYLKEGKIAKWNRRANSFVKYLGEVGECALRIVEFGIGTNPKHKRPIGNILHDEKILGSCHIAFGGGGHIRRCPIHEDVILMAPTIWADGHRIMENGKVKR